MMDYQNVKKFMLNKLRRKLSPKLYYHDLSHTLDVLKAAERLMDSEKLNPEERLIIQTACIFHDAGMLITYIGHEEASCQLAAEILPRFGYSQDQIRTIQQIILTTKLPQSARTTLEYIICDADLDYLGRRDFFVISHKLKYEWEIHQYRTISLKDWYKLQVAFLQNHRYFTTTARELRETVKQDNLRQILELFEGKS